MNTSEMEHLRIVFSDDFSDDETSEIVNSVSKFLPTKESHVAADSVESIVLGAAVIVFLILSPVAEGFLKSIGSDLYDGAKEKIIKILGKKTNPKLFFKFQSAYNNTDIVIKSETNDITELNIIFDTINKARELAIKRLIQDELMVTVNYDKGWVLEDEPKKQVTEELTKKHKETIMPNKQKLERLTLFEAVIVGIYGNWLISFLDKISFADIIDGTFFQIPYYQALFIVVAFAALILFFVFAIFNPENVTKSFAVTMYTSHLIGIVFTAMLEDINSGGKGLSFWLYIVLGISIYCIIYITELFRVRFSSKKGLR